MSQSPTLTPGWYYWGAEEGRGNDVGKDQTVPELIPDDIRDVCAGSRHTLLIQETGVAFAAGFVESKVGYRGHLGLGEVIEEDDCKDPSKEFCEGGIKISDPLMIDKVVDDGGKKVNAPLFSNVYCGVGVPADSGEMHSAILSEDGVLYITGNNNKGQLCLGSDEPEQVNYFHEVKGIPKVKMAAIGEEFTLILTEGGDVYGCGSNEFGQIGQGELASSNKPVKIDGLKDIKEIAAGLSFSLYLNDDGKVFSSGSNIYLQHCKFTEGEPLKEVEEVSFFLHPCTWHYLVRYLIKSFYTYHQIKLGAKSEIIQVEASRESSYFLLEDGTARSCGRNDEGQLGDGTFLNSSEKKPIVTVKLDKGDIESLGSGASAQSVFFIGKDQVWAAGLNDRHQLGIDRLGSEEFPVKVEFECAVSIDYISASGSHTVADGRYLDC